MPNLGQHVANYEIRQVGCIAKRRVRMLPRVISQRLEPCDRNAVGLAEVRRPARIFVEPVKQDVSKSASAKRSLSFVELEFGDGFPSCWINSPIAAGVDSDKDIALSYFPDR